MRTKQIKTPVFMELTFEERVQKQDGVTVVKLTEIRVDENMRTMILFYFT